jgi:hypothetical protein
MPPFGNELASGSLCSNSLPLKASMGETVSMPSLILDFKLKKQSCFSAVVPVCG